MDPYTQMQLELLNKLHAHTLSARETLILVLTTFLLPLPANWRFFLYFLLTSPGKVVVFPSLLSPVILAIGVVILGSISFLITQLFLWKRLLKKRLVILELTPPYDTSQSAFATEQLFIVLHSLARQKSGWEKFLQIKKTYSLEIVASKEDDIRYLFATRFEDKDVLEKTLRSYLPSVEIREVKDYLSGDLPKDPGEENGESISKLLSFSFSNHFAFPLKKQKILDLHDPISYITGAMTQLRRNELFSWQIVATPIEEATHFRKHREVRKIADLILNNGDVFGHLSASSSPWYFKFPLFLISLVLKTFILGVYIFVILPVTFVLQLIAGVVSDGRNPGPPTLPIPFLGSPKTVIQLNPHQEEVQNQIKEKVGQQLFETSIRLLVVSPDRAERQKRESGLVASLSSLTNHPWQGLKANKENVVLNLPIFQNLRYFLFRERFLDLSSDVVLSASEITDLYHFPQLVTSRTEDLVKRRSPELAAPLSLKKDSHELAVTFARNTYGNRETLIGLTEAERKRHQYILGGTGAGKTTLMKRMILEDMEKGRGLAVFDPHGDLCHDLLPLVPKHRLKDVIYFNPADKDFPLGLNLLSPGIKFTDKDEEQEWIASCALSVFMKLTAKEYWGPRLEHILRNATLTALQTEDPTLYTIQRLLTDRTYRKEIAVYLADPILKQFWEKEFKHFGSMQQAQAISPITNKLGKFITSKLCRNILLQLESSLNIAEIMDEGKILICNLSKGDLGEDRSFFFGTLLTSLVQLGAYHRAQLPETQRRDFYLYIDEFQNFATPAFADILSEARKYHLYAILSHQSISQIEDLSLVKVVLANVGNISCFKAGPDDEAFILPFLSPEVKAGEIYNLSPHHFFMKVNNEYSEEAFSGETIVQTDPGDVRTQEAVVKYSRDHYATPKEVVEKQLEKLFETTGKVALPKNGNGQKNSKGLNGHNHHGDEISQQVEEKMA